MSTDKHWVATDFGGIDAFAFVDVDVAAPGAGEVTIEVRAAGMNPADFKHTVQPSDRSLPIPIGYEVAGVVSAVGDGAGFEVGDEVIAFRVSGGYATHLTVDASNVFRKPPGLTFPEAANLMLAGATAMDALHVTTVTAGDTVLVHGASGAVGVMVLQCARMLGARVIGTASEGRFDVVRGFGGEPVAYGPGLDDRVRALADEVDVAIDTVGTAEATEVSLALVPDRQRIVTIANAAAARELGFLAIGGTVPASAAYRDSIRGDLVSLAASGDLVVPMARTFPLADAIEALELLKGGHPGGKLALIP
jgi:NADPH:quinone reductase-like Zn-dependent oxidoreductase